MKLKRPNTVELHPELMHMDDQLYQIAKEFDVRQRVLLARRLLRWTQQLYASVPVDHDDHRPSFQFSDRKTLVSN